MNLDFANLLSLLLSPELQEKLFIFKIIFIVFSLFLILGIIYVLLKSEYLKKTFGEDLIEFLTYRSFEMSKLARQWSKITKRLEKAGESEAKLIVIEADQILDNVLKRMGYGGETLEEKLQLITPADLPNINQLRETHKIRNNIIHDPDYRLSLDETKRVIAIYEKALIDLEVL